jgi:hypothetical protein
MSSKLPTSTTAAHRLLPAAGSEVSGSCRNVTYSSTPSVGQINASAIAVAGSPSRDRTTVWQVGVLRAGAWTAPGVAGAGLHLAGSG